MSSVQSRSPAPINQALEQRVAELGASGGDVREICGLAVDPIFAAVDGRVMR
jgi:hypothetical protein